jgi:hypothetical protein
LEVRRSLENTQKKFFAGDVLSAFVLAERQSHCRAMDFPGNGAGLGTVERPSREKFPETAIDLSARLCVVLFGVAVGGSLACIYRSKIASKDGSLACIL